jgi:glycosyltransferase involved in cell wall biosynthesis
MKILQSHEKVLARKDMQTSYLDRFSLKNYDLSPISVVIPTFNRSPNSPEEDSNPLGWCLESLLAQKGGVLDEIIIVDDGSVDYTKELVKHFSNIAPTNIVYLKNNENKGVSFSMNRGIKRSRNNLLMFVDDDCIFSKYMLFGANYTLNKLGNKAAALQLPVYHRRIFPRPLEMNKIGVLDLEKGVMDGNYDGFPVEYAEDLENRFIDKKLKIIKPFEIKNMGGIILSKKEALEEAGLFPEFFTWRNNYRIESYLSMELSDSGYALFFTPDPKFHCIHLKYGAHSDQDNHKEINPTLRRLINQSNITRENTGCRVDPEEWFFSRIISTYVTLGIKSQETAKRYREETRKTFVEENGLRVSGVGTKIKDKNERDRIFKKAVREGDKLMGKFA